MEIRVYKDGAKTGKTTKLIVAGFFLAIIAAISAYSLFELKLPFLEVQTFTIIAVFLTGISTFGKFKGLPLWQFFYLAVKFRLTTNQRQFLIERKTDESNTSKERKGFNLSKTQKAKDIKEKI